MKKLRNFKRASGITLIALVVSIVVLIILTTVSINVVLGENGLIRKAQQAKELHESAVREEEEALNTLLAEYENVINGGGGSSPEPTTSPTPTPPTMGPDGILPESAVPKVTDGMTRVKYDSATSKWIKVEKDENTGEVGAWYNYSDSTEKDGIVAKSWANVVIPSDGYTASSLFDASGNLNESANYIQLVWIPRYAYQITSAYHYNSSTAGDISIVFIDTANKGTDGTKYSEDYPEVTDVGTATGRMNDFVVHPAFNFGTDKLGGFWVGKFETSTDASATGVYNASETIRVIPNVASRSGIIIGNAFELCQKMKSNNVHGLSSTTVDPHLMKNDEWGAVAYLSKSKYGKQTEEVWINNNSNYLTGQAGNSASASSAASTNSYKTTNGVKASTTGNATGIYDMSGGVWEFVAGYVANENDNITTNGGNIGKSKYEKYVNKYEPGLNDTMAEHYKKANPTDSSNTTKHYGDALWETSSSGDSTSESWYDDYAVFSYSNAPFFARGGNSSSSTGAGVFGFNYAVGGTDGSIGFRVVVPVL